MATSSLPGLRQVCADGHVGLSDADLNVVSFIKDAVVPEIPRGRVFAAQAAGTAAARAVLVAA